MVFSAEGTGVGRKNFASHKVTIGKAAAITRKIKIGPYSLSTLILPPHHKFP